VIDDELRRAQARLQLDRIEASELVALAFDAVAAGRESAALFDLVGQAVATSQRPQLYEVAPLWRRAFGELGVAPIDDAIALERLLWEPARRIAAGIFDGTMPPLDGACAIENLDRDFDHPVELRDFCLAWDEIRDAQAESPVRVPEFERKVLDAARTLLRVRA
jgi:hypothetical protein